MRVNRMFTCSTTFGLAVLFGATLIEAQTATDPVRRNCVVSLSAPCTGVSTRAKPLEIAAMVEASPALFTADGTTSYFTTLRRLQNSSMTPSSFALYGLEHPPSLKLLPPLPPLPLPPLLPPRPKPTAVPETSTALILGAELLALGALFFWRHKVWA
jgi:hypothetical protein